MNPEEKLLNAIFPELDPNREPTHKIEITVSVDGKKLEGIAIKYHSVLLEVLCRARRLFKRYSKMRKIDAPKPLLDAVLAQTYEYEQYAKAIDENVWYAKDKRWGTKDFDQSLFVQKDGNSYRLTLLGEKTYQEYLNEEDEDNA